MKELPIEIKSKILSVLHKNQKWIYYVNRLNEYKKKRNLSGVKKMQDILDKLENDTLNNYISSVVEESSTIADLMEDMSEKHQEILMTSLHGVCFMCDIINILLLDANDVINKYYPDSKLSYFDKLNKLREEVKVQSECILENQKESNKDFFYKYSGRMLKYMETNIKTFLKRQKKLKARAIHAERHHEK